VGGIVSLPFLKPVIYDVGKTFVPKLPGPPVTGLLSPAQMETVLAYAEALANTTNLSEETRQELRSHIDDRTQNAPGYLSLFKMTAAFVSQLGAGDFSKLSLANRAEILEKRGLMSCRVHRRECFSPFGRRERAIRALAAADLVAAYYRSAAGWAVMGYSYPRGHCADLTRYTRAEG
jgi:hypothetical protein